MAPQIFHIIICSLSTLHLNILVSAIPSSVYDDPGYHKLQPCARECIGRIGRLDNVTTVPSCGDNSPNECWCGVKQFDLAVSGVISGCISKSCAAGDWEEDYSSAESFHTSYCDNAGFTPLAIAPVTVAAAQTSHSNSTTVESTASVVQRSGSSSLNPLTTTVEPTISQTESIQRESSRRSTSTAKAAAFGSGAGGSAIKGGLKKKSDKIALGVGLGIGLPACIAAIVWCCILIARRR